MPPKRSKPVVESDSNVQVDSTEPYTSPRAQEIEVEEKEKEKEEAEEEEDQQESSSNGKDKSRSSSKGKSKEKEKEKENGWSSEEEEDFDHRSKSNPKSRAGGVGDTSLEEPLSPDLIASLPVYLSTSLPKTSSLHVFQYPIFNKENPLPVPSQARSAGLNETIRWRPKANRIEIELPIDDRPSVYDSEKGRKLGKGAKIEKEIGDGKIKKEKSKSFAFQDDKKDVTASSKLRKTRLESNEIPHTTGYMIGVIRDGALHLTPVESIIQLRPSMHYLDEIDKQNKEAGRRGGMKSGGGEELSDVEMSEGNQSSNEKETKPKSKAMAMHSSVKAGDIGKGGPGDRDTLMKAQRLADGEAWVDLEWNGVESAESDAAFKTKLFASTKSKLDCKTKPREYLPVM